MEPNLTRKQTTAIVREVQAYAQVDLWMNTGGTATVEIAAADAEAVKVALRAMGYGSTDIRERVVSTSSPDLEREAREVYRDRGQGVSKIQAIKRVRELTDWGLKESGRFVDDLIERGRL